MPYELPDEGVYWGTLADWGMNQTKTSKWFYGLIFRVTHISNGQGGSAALPHEMSRTVKLFLDKEENMPEWNIRKLGKLGFNWNYASGDFGAEATEKGVWLTCKHSFSNNKTYDNWDLYEPDQQRTTERVEAPQELLDKLNAKGQQYADKQKDNIPF